MLNCKPVYEPQEDSIMLDRYVRHYAKGNVLDIGTGSGIQAIAAAQNNNVDFVLATDVQKSAIEYCKRNIKNKKIKFIQSNLFGNINRNFNTIQSRKPKVFDTIIFNPPYLPSGIEVKDLTVEGGKKGYEILERFFNEVNNFLKANGIILIVFSSLTKKVKIDEFIINNLLEYELLGKEHYFFEDLFVYLIKKSDLLKSLENKKINSIRYFARGKRGLIFTGIYKNKKVAIKIKNSKSSAFRINNEIKYLKILNKKNIGPKLLFYNNDFLVYWYVDGIYILDFFKKQAIKKKTMKNNTIEKNNEKNILKKIFKQLFIMDKLRINKEEMSHPMKHIIINKKNNPILLDFERAHYTLKPGNVTQFCDFLISNHFLTLLKTKIKLNKKKIISCAKEYKKNQNRENFNKILKLAGIS